MSAGKQSIASQDLIAIRELSVEGQEEKVVVQLGRPHVVNDGEAICPYRILYRDTVCGIDAHGVDTFQAMELALKMLPTDLRTAKCLPLGKMFAFDPGDDMGFPEFYK
jgi:Domain of unknown function (DUF6968)